MLSYKPSDYEIISAHAGAYGVLGCVELKFEMWILRGLHRENILCDPKYLNQMSLIQSFNEAAILILF